MPIQSCQACGRNTPSYLLHESSRLAHVNYYRCGFCGHIWTADKQDPSKVTNITPLPEPPPTKKPA